MDKINFKIKKQFNWLYYKLILKHCRIVKLQRKNPMQIPVIIINYNQLFYLKKLVSFLRERKFEKIIIVDNQSNYPPLLNYYNEIKDDVVIERMQHNYGHLVFLKNKQLQRKYGRGYFIMTDADILPNNQLPCNFVDEMLSYLDKYFKSVTKVGFALDIDHIPDSYPLKEKVISWEAQFWKHEIEPDLYKANIDTTFALYKPCYPQKFSNLKFLQAIRIAGNYTALHGGWHVDPNHYTDENLHYINSVQKSSSWKLDEAGKHDNKGDSNYNI